MSIKIGSIVSKLTDETYIGSSELVAIPTKVITEMCDIGSTELNFEYSKPSQFLASVLAGAQLYEIPFQNLISRATSDLLTCCPAETTISIFPLSPDSMIHAEQHFSIMRDYYDG